jgi:hypothetical protein
MQSTKPPPPLPPPFLDHKDAYLSMGFHRQHIETSTSECLLQFFLYAQARSRGRQWSIRTTNNDAAAGRFNITHLQVDFDADCNHSMGIVFVVQSNAQDAGFYWLHIHSISAFCSTMAEALHAINAITQYVPVLNQKRIDTLNRMRFQSYVCRSMEIMANNQSDETLQDHIHINAMRRKLGDDDHINSSR